MCFFSKKVSHTEACKYTELVVSRNLQRRKCPEPHCPFSSLFWLCFTTFTTHFPQVQLPYTKRQTQNICYYTYEHCFWSRGTNCSQDQSTLCSQGPTISINSLSKNIYWAAMFCQILRRPYKIKHEQGIWLALSISRFHIHWFNELWILKIWKKKF